MNELFIVVCVIGEVDLDLNEEKGREEYALKKWDGAPFITNYLHRRIYV